MGSPVSAHANRQPQNPQFTEAQRLTRELLRTAGLDSLKVGHVTLHIADYQLREIEAQPAPTRVRLQRVE